ncbi:MAG: twin-arginine translocation signal domain-containing protein, partial [Gammaproteobacteria bacterium]|nr:twin-arginine translocation signal domain-containing protein [Gammaproteobacteria bacterium]
MTHTTTSALTRRHFLKTTAQAGAVAVAPAFIPSSALGRDGAVAPSERIILGGIGIHRRGGYVLSTMLPLPDVRFAAIADVRASQRAVVKATADKHNGDDKCVMYRDFRDFRELLERDDIDAVLIATGDHWHAHASMLAAEAG